MQDLFSFLAVSRKPSFAQIVFNLSTVSVPVCLFRLMLVRLCIGVIVTSICKLMSIGRWSEPMLVFVCQLVEVKEITKFNLFVADAICVELQNGEGIPIGSFSCSW